MNGAGQRVRWLLAALLWIVWCGSASAAITEIAATSAASANGSATALSVSVPSGTVANDVLLVQIAASKTGETITPPSGWTAIRSDNQSYLAVGITQALYYRVANGLEPASYSFGISSAAGIAGSMITFRGVDTNAPIGGNSGQGGAALLDTAPSIASCQAGTMQVAFFGYSTSLLSLTLGVGLTPYSSNSTNAAVGLTIANGGTTLASAGTCPAYTVTAVSLTANIGQQVALTPTQAVSGTVYVDANHDGALSSGESGVGQTTYVKLASGSPGACQSPATQIATADATTGAYSFTSVNAGSYCLISSTNTTLSDVTATTPSGYLRTETPTGVRSLTIAGAATSGQNFGLYAGSTVAGRVFTDNGAGGGTANDGVVNGSESGVANATVNLLSGASTVTTTVTDGSGNYTLWIASSNSGTLTIAQPLLNGAIATGGSAGTTSGTYVRASNATSFTFASGQVYTGANFGTVPANTLLPDAVRTVSPGNIATFAHTFTAGSAGTVTFSTSATATPSAVTFVEALILDSNCNGAIDAAEPLITATIAVTAGQVVCVIVKESVPAGAPLNAQNAIQLSAAMSYTGASPALSSTVRRVDTTIVSVPNVLQLAKQVRNVTQSTAFATSNSAAPNDVIEYQLTATNPSSGAVSVIVISDGVPAYTGFVSASCPGTLPTGISACGVTTQPAVGAQGSVQWSFTGTLGSGAQAVVTYQVRVTQ